MKPLHEELKELREEQQITLKEVANRTRIRLDFLKRLEAGDYTVAPMPFVRAFFREYAEVLEVDPAKAMARLDGKLDTILDPRPVPEPVPQPPSTVEPDAKEPAPVDEETETASEEPPVEEVTEPEHQQSLFDAAADVDETPEPGTSAEPAATESEPEEKPVPETEQTDTVDEAEGEESGEPKIDDPVPAAVVESAEPAQELADPMQDGTLEIDLDENGATPPTVRRPLEIEEQKSFSNMIFAAIVGIMLIIAGVLIYLNRAEIF